MSETMSAAAPEISPVNQELPIAAHRSEIEAHLLDDAVSIFLIHGRTGSGKTTQAGKYAHELNAFDQIVITQPRVMAAREVSQRMIYEAEAEGIDCSIDYYTGRESGPKPQREQDIALLTDGKAAAQILHQKKNPNTKRVLIIDEVHEWSLDTEQLVAYAAVATDPDSELYDPNLKVVIMSATLDSDGLRDHFAHANPPVVNIDVPTFEVARLASRFSAARLALVNARKKQTGVLTFLPGKGEIGHVVRTVQKAQSEAHFKVPVVPLHGQQARREQSRAFHNYDSGVIIAASPAAQTSVTVPDVATVIDTGEIRVDRVRYDLVSTGSSGLYLEEAPKSDIDQRAGRTGRVCPGEHILCSPDGKTPPTPYEDRPEYMPAAIERSSLDGMLLRLKAAGRDVADFKYFHQPPEQELRASRKRLIRLGALDNDGVITERGQFMNSLPLDPEYACMIAFAREKNFSDEVKGHILDIVSIMQLGGIVQRSADQGNWRELLEKNSSGDMVEMDSDFMAQHAIYLQLLNRVPRHNWGSYGIIERNALLVPTVRQDLARRLKVPLHKPARIEKDDRADVITAIHAGQLNQIWKRKDDGWRIATLGRSGDFKLSKASVVGKIGNLSTGTLFSIGVRDKSIERIDQIVDVNRVIDPGSLARAAAHLTRETVDPSTIEYDPNTQHAVAVVERALGDLTLQTFVRPVEIRHDSPEAEIISEGYRKEAWASWEERTKPRVKIAKDEIDVAIENPESKRYGIDPITGQELMAYKCADGHWCQYRDSAIHSLESYKRRLENAQDEVWLRKAKKENQQLFPRIYALKKSGDPDARLLVANKRKLDAFDWMEQAYGLLGVRVDWYDWVN